MRRFDPQTVGRTRTLLSRIPGTVKVHELSRAIHQWKERVSSYQARAREIIISDVVLSRILTEMCPEHIETHIHLNLTRLPDYAAVRSEIETFLEARQSSSNPDAMDIGSLNGQKGVCGSHLWTARPLDSRVSPGRQAQVMMARDRVRKARRAKAQLTVAKAKVANCKHGSYSEGTAITVRKRSHGKGLFHFGKKQGQGWRRQMCRQS